MKKNKLLTNSEISSFCQQTYFLLQAGISPFDGMDILLEDASDSRMKSVITVIKETCMMGERFSVSCEKSEAFPDYVIHMISLGEESGHLTTIMKSLAAHYEREDAISDSIKDAVRYPLIMISMMFLVVIILIAKVLPIFNQVYIQLGADMTGFAASLLGVSNILSKYSLVFLIIFLIVILAIFLVMKSSGGKAFINALWIKIPFGKSFRESIAAGRFASGMSLTLSSGLDTYESLDLVKELVEHPGIESKIESCRNLIANGEPFSDALKKSKIFSVFYSQMVVVGSRSGSLDTVMGQIADHYEEDTENKIRSLISTLEPTLVIILSMFVGLVLLSVMLPLMGVMSMIG